MEEFVKWWSSFMDPTLLADLLSGILAAMLALAGPLALGGKLVQPLLRHVLGLAEPPKVESY